MTKANKTFNELLAECLVLKAKTGRNAHNRIALLSQVYGDDQYRQFCVENGKDSDRNLDQYVDDLCLDFTELSLMFQTFPNISDWKDGNLRSLYARTLEKIKSHSNPEKRTSYKAMSQELEIERDELASEVEQLKAEIVSLQNKLIIANEVAHEKDLENANLKGRITELEKLVQKDTLAAS